MVEIPLEAFAVCCTVRAFPQADHVSHLEVVTPLTCKYMPFKRALKLLAGVRKFPCQVLTFVPPDVASSLLGPLLTIVEAIKTLFPLLYDRAPPFKEAIYWLQFTYTAERIGDYVAPASTVIFQSVVSEGDILLSLAWRHLQKIYPGAYAPPRNDSPIDSSGYSPIDRAPERGETDPGMEEEEEEGGWG